MIAKFNPDVAAALNTWVTQHPDPDLKMLAVGSVTYSPNEFVKAYRDNDPLILDLVASGISRVGINGLIAAFNSSTRLSN